MEWEPQNPEVGVRSKKNRPFRAYSRTSRSQRVGANLLPVSGIPPIREGLNHED